jgi:transcriptional regulator with XRE-family HTH domain
MLNQHQKIGEIILNRRKVLKLSQQDLAEMAGVATKSVYQVENGQGNPGLITLSKLLEVLGLEINIQIRKTA